MRDDAEEIQKMTMVSNDDVDREKRYVGKEYPRSTRDEVTSSHGNVIVLDALDSGSRHRRLDIFQELFSVLAHFYRGICVEMSLVIN